MMTSSRLILRDMMATGLLAKLGPVRSRRINLSEDADECLLLAS